MKNKKCAVKTALQICPFARWSEGYYGIPTMNNVILMFPDLLFSIHNGIKCKNIEMPC